MQVASVCPNSLDKWELGPMAGPKAGAGPTAGVGLSRVALKETFLDRVGRRII